MADGMGMEFDYPLCRRPGGCAALSTESRANLPEDARGGGGWELRRPLGARSRSTSPTRHSRSRFHGGPCATRGRPPVRRRPASSCQKASSSYGIPPRYAIRARRLRRNTLIDTASRDYSRDWTNIQILSASSVGGSDGASGGKWLLPVSQAALPPGATGPRIHRAASAWRRRDWGYW